MTCWPLSQGADSLETPCGWLSSFSYARKATHCRLLDLLPGVCFIRLHVCCCCILTSLLSLVTGIFLQVELCVRSLKMLMMLSSS